LLAVRQGLRELHRHEIGASRAPARRLQVRRRVRIAVEDQRVGSQLVVELAIRQVHADDELGQQGVFDPQENLVGGRR
jgi:hypothetical protein